MNSPYPVWWDETITIYNKQVDSTTRIVKWYRTQLSKCFWKRVTSDVESNNAINAHYYTICRIPENMEFREYEEWVEGNLDKYFTLNAGDIIIRGKCDDEIDEYQQGRHSTDLLNKHKNNALQINEFSIDTFTGMKLPHYRVVGK